MFTEDKEAILFTKKLLGTKSNKLKFINITMPCSSLIDLSYRKVPSFSFPESLIIIDGDVRNDNQNKNKIKKTKTFYYYPASNRQKELLPNYYIILVKLMNYGKIYIETIQNNYASQNINMKEFVETDTMQKNGLYNKKVN